VRGFPLDKRRSSSLEAVNFDFRFRNANGKWESVGHQRGADRTAAFEELREKTPGGFAPGRYMSRPRTRQKDWDLFSLDRDGKITQAAPVPAREALSSHAGLNYR
jgi:hypothetical protein